MMQTCQVDARRDAVRHSRYNGLDYAEVLEVSPGVWALEVYLLGKLPEGFELNPENIRITGGRRITDLRAVRVEAFISPDDSLDDVLRIDLNKRGDFSSYRLRIIKTKQQSDQPPATTDVNLKTLNFDPRYESLEFGFPSECASDLDCAVSESCPPDAAPCG